MKLKLCAQFYSHFRPFEKPMLESLFNFGKKWKTLMNFANKKRAFINQHKQVLFTIQFYLLWTYCLWTSTWVMSKHVFEFLQISCCSIVPLAHWWVKKKHDFFYRCENSGIQNRVNEKQQILYELPNFDRRCWCCCYYYRVWPLSFERLQANSLAYLFHSQSEITLRIH